MSRARVRVCLQDGLKLDLNQLARQGFIKFGTDIGPRGISWSGPRQRQVARGVISADMTKSTNAWFRIAISGFVQQITMASRPRHLGGRQYFFVCPATGRLATVLWMPPGADRFLGRQAWGRQVAYASQFMDRDSRAHYAQSKINSRLCSIGQFDPYEWSFPPKPKWMRWKTYKRHEQKFDQYEEVLDSGIQSLVAKLGGL